MPGLKDNGLRWTFRYLSSYVFKTHYPLLALYIPTGVACFAGLVFAFRGLMAPDVGVIKNKMAWENVPRTYQFQLYCPEKDFFKDLDKGVPKIE